MENFSRQTDFENAQTNNNKRKADEISESSQDDSFGIDSETESSSDSESETDDKTVSVFKENLRQQEDRVVQALLKQDEFRYNYSLQLFKKASEATQTLSDKSTETLNTFFLQEQIRNHFETIKKTISESSQEELAHHEQVLLKELESLPVMEKIEKRMRHILKKYLKEKCEKQHGKLENLVKIFTEDEGAEVLWVQLGEIFERINATKIIKNAIDYQELKLNRKITDFMFEQFFPEFTIIDPFSSEVMEEGFLTNVVIKSVKVAFKEIYKVKEKSFVINELVSTSLKALAANEKSNSLSREYIKAAENYDILGLQRTWMQIVPLLEKMMSKDPIKEIQKTVEQKGYLKKSEKIKKFYKIYPSDQTDELMYPSSKKNRKSVSQPLKPIFDMLSAVGRNVKTIVDKASSKDKSTNIVSAMLSFVVSTEPQHKGGKHERKFINVPLVFEYSNSILSKDEKDGVFKNPDEFYRSTAADQQLGGEIIGLPYNTTSLQEKKTETILDTVRLLEGIKWANDEQKKSLNALMEAAKVLPFEENYYYKAELELKSKIDKDQEYNHSERVLFHALKQLDNVKKIVQLFKEELQKALSITALVKGKYKVYAGALIMASIPNTICKECSVGIIALQNSYEDGFLDLLIKEFNASQEFKTRGYDDSKKDPTKFGISTVVVAERKFCSQSKFIANYPAARLALKLSINVFDKKDAINLNFSKTANNRNFFYEYVNPAFKEQNNQQLLSFKGQTYMSGSINSKKIDRVCLNKIAKTL